jgi:RND family efflux transporter MFP subunit
MKIVSSLLIIGLIGFGWFSFRDGNKLERPHSPIQVVTVNKGNFVSSVTAEGRIVARKLKTIKSPCDGTILDSGLRPGQFVPEGTVVTKIRPTEENLRKKRQELKLAELDLELSRLDFEQAQELYKTKAISEKELKEARLRVLRGEIQVENLKEEIEDKLVRTSFGGLILNKKFINDDEVSASKELLTLVDPNSICIELKVHQFDISKTQAGQRVRFTSEVFKDLRYGNIFEISDMATTLDGSEYSKLGMASSYFQIYATIENNRDDKLPLGATVKAEIIIEEKLNVISLPLEAVRYEKGQQLVFILDDGIARKRIVKTGAKNEHAIEIVSGLSVREQVITAGNFELQDGARVN